MVFVSYSPGLNKFHLMSIVVFLIIYFSQVFLLRSILGIIWLNPFLKSLMMIFLTFMCRVSKIIEVALQGCFYKKLPRKIWSKFTGEHPCQSVISVKLQSNFLEITLRHGCSPVNLLHIFKTPFPKNSSERQLL